MGGRVSRCQSVLAWVRAVHVLGVGRVPGFGVAPRRTAMRSESSESGTRFLCEETLLSIALRDFWLSSQELRGA
jgi:hypothetical protein